MRYPFPFSDTRVDTLPHMHQSNPKLSGSRKYSPVSDYMAEIHQMHNIGKREGE